VTTAAVLGGSATGPLALREFSPARKSRLPCRAPAMPNGCRVHGGMSPGAPKGNKNAFKHGRYTAEAIANRREIMALLQTMRALMRATGKED
jgi:hypothetical protein